MKYRELKANDFDSYNNIRGLALETFPNSFISTNEEEIETRKEKFLTTIKNEFNFVLGAFDINELIGIVTFLRENRLKTKHKGGIYGMFVKDNYQSKGIASKLMENVLEKAFKIDGITQINLGVSASNHKAIKLYEKFGFNSYGLEKSAFYVNGIFFDDLLMVKFR